MPEVSATHRAIEAVWRIESACVIATLARTLGGDVGLAEEVAQEALLAALEQWPVSGIPENPGAWLTAAGKHKAIDILRRHRRFQRAHEDLTREHETNQSKQHTDAAMAALDLALDGAVEDDLLRLVFTACHPVLPDDTRTALVLRVLCGLTTAEIARAFLVHESTIAQRIVRGKRLLIEKQIPFEVPVGPKLDERLTSVLEVMYLLFNEGYAATAGDDWMRPILCEEALRLARILAGLMPDEPEVHGLTALMEIQASRVAARVDAAGNPILLLDQNRALWDQLLIRRGLAALETARETAGRIAAAPGPYVLQASIAACHARAHLAADTDWGRIARLYAELASVMPSPIIELNRAVAVSMANGPQAGLDLVDQLLNEPSLRTYHLLPSVRGDLLNKLGLYAEARTEFDRAAALTGNAREKELLRTKSEKLKLRIEGMSDGINQRINRV